MLNIIATLTSLGKHAEGNRLLDEAVILLGGLHGERNSSTYMYPSSVMARYYYELGVHRGILGGHPAAVRELLVTAKDFIGAEFTEKTSVSSGLRCKIAFQLAMGAGMSGNWVDAVSWLEESLLVPRALDPEKSMKAAAMLREATQRLGEPDAKVTNKRHLNKRRDRSHVPAEHKATPAPAVDITKAASKNVPKTRTPTAYEF